MDEIAQAALERIREKYGRTTTDAASHGDQDNSGYPGESARHADPHPDPTGGETGTAGINRGGLNSWLRRNGQQNGNDNPGTSGDSQGIGGSDGSDAASGPRARTPEQPSPVVPKKPRGILALPSPNEQIERDRAVSESGEDIVKIIRVAKNGKTQVRLRNGLFRWLETPPGEVLSTAEVEPGLVNSFTGQSIDGDVSRETSFPDIPIRNIPNQTPPKAKGIPIPVPGGTVKDGKFSAENFAEAVKDHMPKLLVVAKGVMGKREAEDSRKELADAIYEGFKVMDKVISGTTKGHPAVQIWSNITDGELYTLADSWLLRAQLSAKDAKRVRQLIALTKQFKVGAILLPRFAKTWMAYTNWGFEMPGASARGRKAIRR